MDANTKKFNVGVLVALLVGSTLVFTVTPTASATVYDLTSAADIGVNVTQTPATVVVDAGSTTYSFTSIMVPTSPAGTKLRAGTAYDLTFEGIYVANAGGAGFYGYAGASATSVKIVNSSDGSNFDLGSSPISANLAGSNAAQRDAPFGGIVFPKPGVYTVIPGSDSSITGSNQIARILVYPPEDIGITIQPSTVTYSETGSLVTITATNSSGAASSATIQSDASGFIQGSGVTNTNGQLSFFSTFPMGAGTWKVFGLYELTPNNPGGTNLPERLSNTTFTVTPLALTKTDINTTAFVGFRQTVSSVPKFPTTNNLVFPTSGSPSPNWPAATGGWTNISVTMPNGYIAFRNTTSASTIQTLSPTCLNTSATSGGAQSCATIHGGLDLSPSLFQIGSEGAVNFAPPTATNWLSGTYTFKVEVNTAGGASSPAEYSLSWTLSPGTPASVNLQATPVTIDVPAPTSFDTSGTPGTAALSITISGSTITEHPLCAVSNAAGTSCVTAGWETDASFLDNITITGDVLSGWSVSTYTPASGVAVISGLTPTRNGTITVTVNWKNVTTSINVPIARGAVATASVTNMTVDTSTVFTIRVRDAFNNDVTTGSVVLMKRTGGAGSFSGTAVQSITGTGAPDFGAGGLYKFTLTPSAVQDLVAVARIGSGTDTNYSYVAINVTPASDLQTTLTPVQSMAQLRTQYLLNVTNATGATVTGAQNFAVYFLNPTQRAALLNNGTTDLFNVAAPGITAWASSSNSSPTSLGAHLNVTLPPNNYSVWVCSESTTVGNCSTAKHDNRQNMPVVNISAYTVTFTPNQIASSADIQSNVPVQVRVTDRNGNAVNGTLTVDPTSTATVSGSPSIAVSNGFGNATLTGTAVGTLYWLFDPTDPGSEIDAESRVVGSISVIPGNLTFNPSEIQVGATTFVNLRLTNFTGAGLPGRVLRLCQVSTPPATPSAAEFTAYNCASDTTLADGAAGVALTPLNVTPYAIYVNGSYSAQQIPVIAGVLSVSVSPSTGLMAPAATNVTVTLAGNPLSGVTVNVTRDGTAVISQGTDATGKLALTNLQAGSYTVLASRTGYRNATATFTVGAVNVTPTVPTNVTPTTNVTVTTPTVNVTPTNFTLTNISVSSPVQVGTNVNISGDLKNNGNESDNATVQLYINGARNTERTFNVPAGGTQRVVFNFTPVISGTYAVELRLATGQVLASRNVTVNPAVTTPTVTATPTSGVTPTVTATVTATATGTAPATSTAPATATPTTTPSPKVPGFEVVALVAALGVALLVLRRRS